MHIYKITNLLDGKFYVGKTVNSDLSAYFEDKRWRAMNGHHDNPRLFNAMRKHGLENFVVESLVQTSDVEQLAKMEIFFIRTFGSQVHEVGYNVSAGGDGGRPSYMWTQEQRTAARERFKKNPKLNRKGAKHTEAANQKNREAHLGKPRRCGKVVCGTIHGNNQPDPRMGKETLLQ